MPTSSKMSKVAKLTVSVCSKAVLLTTVSSSQDLIRRHCQSYKGSLGLKLTGEAIVSHVKMRTRLICIINSIGKYLKFRFSC